MYLQGHEGVLNYASLACHGDYDYYSDYFYGGFFRRNKKTREIEYLMTLFQDNLLETGVVRKVIYKNGLIIGVPFKGKGIFTYDIASGEAKYFYDEKYFVEGFSNSIEFGNRILLIPTKLSGEFLYLHENGSFSRAETINELAESLFENNENACLDGYSSCAYQGVIYLAIRKSEWIIKIDPKRGLSERIRIEGARLSNLVLLDDSIWLTTLASKGTDGAVIRLDIKTGKYKRYRLQKLGEGHSCYGFAVYQKTVLAFETEGDHIWIYDFKTDAWRIFADKSDYPEEFHRVRQGYPLFWGFHHEDGKLLLLPTGGNGTIAIDEHSDKMTFYSSRMPEDYTGICKNIERERKASLIERAFGSKKQGFITEKSDLDLDAYICFIHKGE